MEVEVSYYVDETDQTNTNETSLIQQFEQFEAKLTEFEEQHQKGSQKPWTTERIKSVIEIIRNAKDLTMSNKHRRTSMEYYWMSKYDIVTEANEDHLIIKRRSTNEQLVFIIPRHEYFSVLKETHESCGHGGRDKMVKILKPKFYIPKKAIEIYLELCPKCGAKQLRKKGFTRPVASQLSHDFNIRGQVDLIDFHKHPDEEFNYVMCYQDDATRFLLLRPLKTNHPNEVARELMKLFTSFGAPYVLQSRDGREFPAAVIEELATFWPECKLVYGTPISDTTDMRPDIEQNLVSWMKRNDSLNWSLGCFPVQYEMNATFNRMLGRSPYKALFGRDPKAGLTDSGIPSTVLMDVDTEEQLKVLSDQVLRKKIEDKDDSAPVYETDPLEVKIEAFPFPEDVVSD
ncbi:hypothetical protein O0L34_g12738 [Tuta absoluta]|nr:hypothetical protein O0L34_g12738 [Tuta absoluta]